MTIFKGCNNDYGGFVVEQRAKKRRLRVRVPLAAEARNRNRKKKAMMTSNRARVERGTGT